MKRSLAILSLVLASASVDAAVPRTFVSSTGLDTNPCSRTAPCRSFSAALAQTAAGGVIIPLDSAGYGAVTISQSVSVIAPEGIYAGITASSGNAITISGTTSTDVVLISGLIIDGAGTGSSAIYCALAATIQSLLVRHCVLTEFVAQAIDFHPTNVGASLYVGDTTVSNTSGGIFLYADPSVNAHAFIDHCRSFGNTYA